MTINKQLAAHQVCSYCQHGERWTLCDVMITATILSNHNHPDYLKWKNDVGKMVTWLAIVGYQFWLNYFCVKAPQTSVWPFIPTWAPYLIIPVLFYCFKTPPVILQRPAGISAGIWANVVGMQTVQVSRCPSSSVTWLAGLQDSLKLTFSH